MKEQIIILAASVFVCLGGASGAEFSPTQRPTLGATLEEFTPDANHEEEDANDGVDLVGPLKSDEINDGGPVEPLRSDESISSLERDRAMIGTPLAMAFRGFAIGVDLQLLGNVTVRKLPQRKYSEPVPLEHWHRSDRVFVAKLFEILYTQTYERTHFLKRFQLVLRDNILEDNKLGIMVSIDAKLADHLNGPYGCNFFMKISGLDQQDYGLMQAYKNIAQITSHDGDMRSIAVFFHSGRETIFYYLPGDINEMHLGRDDAPRFLNEFIPNAWAEEEKRDGTEMLVCPEGKIERLRKGYGGFTPFGPIADQILGQ